ncbi:hypothetical protein ABW20_dc0103837 [Dactylellina cionopaga]|nr:hypothetical protein ABW20_dc0103837 [Dactylellina cionopaga]
MVNILSLPTELLLNIVTNVLASSSRFDAREPPGNNPAYRVGERHNRISIRGQRLKALTETSSRLRSVSYPLLHTEFVFTHSNFVRARKRVPALVPLLHNIQEYPARGEVVRVLAVEPWGTRNFWDGFTVAKKTWSMQVLTKVATDAGLGERRFLEAIELGSINMVLALVIYSLPNLVRVEFTMETGGTSTDQGLSSTMWLKEALMAVKPKCAASLKSFAYGHTTEVYHPWTPALWELLKLPNLETFEGYRLGGVEWIRRVKYGSFSDLLTWDNPGEEREIEWNSLDFDDKYRWGPENSDYPVIEIEKVGDFDPGMGQYIPDEKTPNLKEICLEYFCPKGLNLDRFLALPTALTKLSILVGGGSVTHSDRPAMYRAVISQAATLTDFTTDIPAIYIAKAVRHLTKLKRLRISYRLFRHKHTHSQPSRWLPASLCALVCTAESHQLTEFWRYTIAASKNLRTIDPEALPVLKKITLFVPSALEPFVGFNITQNILATKGIIFKFIPWYGPSEYVPDKTREMVKEATDEDSDIPIVEDSNSSKSSVYEGSAHDDDSEDGDGNEDVEEIVGD